MKHSHDSEDYFLENCNGSILLYCETALSLPSFWQNVICVVSELDQHAADFRGGGFPLSIVSSYHSYSKKKGESGAWRKVSTSPRKKSGRFSPHSWNKPGLSEEGEGGSHAAWRSVGTSSLVSDCKCALGFFNAYFHRMNKE